MNKTRGQWRVVPLAIVGASLLVGGGSRGDGLEPERQDVLFVKAGPYYINAARIRYVNDADDGLLIVLGPNTGDRLKLTHGDADTMRQWLNARVSGRLSSLGPQAPPNGQPGSPRSSNSGRSSSLGPQAPPNGQPGSPRSNNGQKAGNSIRFKLGPEGPKGGEIPDVPGPSRQPPDA